MRCSSTIQSKNDRHDDRRLDGFVTAPRRHEAPAGDDLHAGLVETSVMMRLDSASVRRDAIAPGSAVDIDALRADGVALHSPSGVIGDPTGATAELGEAILVRWTTSLERHIEHGIEHHG